MTNGTRRGWGVSVTPRPLFTPGKDPVPIVQEAVWAPGPVWTGAENLAFTGIPSPDRPARSQSLYRLSYPAHFQVPIPCHISVCHKTLSRVQHKCPYRVISGLSQNPLLCWTQCPYNIYFPCRDQALPPSPSANTTHHFAYAQIVLLVFFISRTLRLAMEQSSENETVGCGGGALVCLHVLQLPRLLNLLNQTPHSAF